MTKEEFIKLCNQEPTKVATLDGEGSPMYIPILELENMLDELHWVTNNFQYQIFKDGHGNLSVAASLELMIEHSQGYQTRNFVGACNFTLASIYPNTHFLATAKSECIKNAASDIGKYFGRGLNNEIVNKPLDNQKQIVKPKPDTTIQKQFTKALLENDQATITLLSNVYDINN